MTAQFSPLSIEPLEFSKAPLTILIEGDKTLASIGSQYLRVNSIQGQEAVSKPFQFSVDVRADDTTEKSDENPILDSSYLGRWVRLGVHGQRWFRGVLTSLNTAAPGRYSLTVESPLAILNMRNRYHIYQQRNIRTLIESVFEQDRLDGKLLLAFDFDDSLTLTRTQDWLQAGETDMEFLSRVTAKFSLYYFFVHQKNTLTLMFSDRPASLEGQMKLAGGESVPVLRYAYTSAEKLGVQQNDLFCDLSYSTKMMPVNVQSMLGRVEADWATNKMAICDATPWVDNNKTGLTAFKHHNYFDYGADSDEDTGQFTKICQQINTEAGTLAGTVTTPLLSPGYSFTLSDPLLIENGKPLKPADQMGKGRPEFSGETFIVTSIQHKVSAEGHYSGSVQATQLYKGTDTLKQTLITPFSIQNTHQGSVMGKVVGVNPPKSQYFFNKTDVDPSNGKIGFDDATTQERGCKVQLVTGQECWVVLPRTSTSVPEINSLVMISRGSNSSEQPEIQVLSSHGSKTITPPGRRKASWTVNGSWGSSYSTSYGDNISVHYGHGSSTTLSGATSAYPTPEKLVEAAYDKDGVAGTSYGSCSYSKDGGWSMSQSDNADIGVLSASVSQGSSYNESHAAESYSVNNTGVSMNFSQTGKSVNYSILGDYDGNIDLDNPSFIAGNLPEKNIVNIAKSLGNGDSFNENYVLGRNINLTGNGVSPGSDIDTIKLVLENIEKDSLTIISGIESEVNELSSLSGLIDGIGSFLSGLIQIKPKKPTGTDILANNYSDTVNLGYSVDKNIHIGGKKSYSVFMGVSADLSVNMGISIRKDIVKGIHKDYTEHEEESEVNVVKKMLFTENKHYLGEHKVDEYTVGDYNEDATYDGLYNKSVSIIGEASINRYHMGAVSGKYIYEGDLNITENCEGIKTVEITNQGDLTKTEINQGAVEITKNNEGEITTMVTNQGIVTDTLTNEGEVTKIRSNQGAVTESIDNLGAVTTDETYIGERTVSQTVLGDETVLNTVGMSTITNTHAGPSVITSEGSPAIETDMRLKTSTIDMQTIMVSGTLIYM